MELYDNGNNEDGEYKKQLLINCENGVYETNEKVGLQTIHQTENCVKKSDVENEDIIITVPDEDGKCPKNIKCDDENLCNRTKNKIRQLNSSKTKIRIVSKIDENIIVKFAYSKCNKCFAHKRSLKQHIKLHNGEARYKCNVCGMIFIRNVHLVSHLRTHTGEKPYECQQCGASFSQIGNLRNHILIHTGEKRFKCSECQMCFSRSSTLKNHTRIHTGEKPYTCVQCGKSFTQNATLQNHLKTHSKRGKCSHW